MKQLILNILAELETIPAVEYARVWNNQHNLVMQGKMELFACPAVFVGFVTGDIMQLGEGVQLFDPLIIEVHILHWQMDASDGTFEQNLDVMDLKQEVFKKMQKFRTLTSGSFVRISEVQDYEHDGLYHYVQTYKTTYVDNTLQEPVNGIEPDEQILGEINLTVLDSADDTAPHVYHIQPSGSTMKTEGGDNLTQENESTILTEG